MVAAGLLFLSLSAGAQPGVKSFRFPAQVTSADYDSRFVLAKLKSSHRDLFRNSTGSNVPGFTQANGFAGAREMFPTNALLSARSRKGPRRSRSTIDTGLYYRLRCTPGTSIEAFINTLYRTGYFERVEPEYINHLTYTPNDPNLPSQFYLGTIRAIEGWDVSKGSSSITIAIVDSGGDLVHEDLAGNLAILADTPGDGIDNDGNQYIDDDRGWDFVGDNVNNLNDPNFIGDNDPQLVAGGNVGHGVSVAGCAAAVPDNTKGIAGVGFNTRLLFTKHTPDNDPASTSVYLGYDGILYAALSGADIINCSWGGTFRSEIIQDMINFITDDLGVLVVAAAGNTGIEAPFYPAAYDNVLSVTAVNTTNVKANFSNFGSFVDVSAPGVGIFTTAYGNAYTSIQGTSFSSPITAGAAALVMEKFPSYTPQQVAEQIRVSANSTELYGNNPGLVGKLGFGLLDVYSALTKSSPSVRASKPTLLNANGSPAQQGEVGFLTMTFKNLLASTSGALEISIVENSNFISIIEGTIRPGAIPSGGSLSNTLAPFKIQIAAFVPDNFEIPLTVKYTDGAYVDQQEIVFLLNPTFIDVDENLVTTTVSNTGRVGFEDTEASTRTKGSGFVFDGNSMLYEMGVMMGTGTGAQLFNNVRSINSGFDQDFLSIGPRITETTPGQRSSSEISGTLSNSTTPASQAFQLTYRSLAWKEAPYDKFVILEYIVKNPTANSINNFYFGLFADWDITTNGVDDIAKWDDLNKLGYVYPTSGSGLPHAGIQILTGSASYFAIDNDQAQAGNPFGLYDGFTDAEKFQSLSSGLGRLEAGVAAGGADVSHVVGAGPFSIAAGQEIRIAFAVHAAHSLSELQLSAQHADTAYNYMLTAPQPVIPETDACYGSAAMINATGAGSFNWYTEFTGGTPFHTGSSFTTGNLLNDTTFYVSNADNFYESVRTAAEVNIKAKPTVTASGSTTICSNESIILGAEEADSYLWSNGATTQTIEVNTAGDYSVTVTSLTPSCQNTSAPVTVSLITAPVAAFTQSGDLKSFSPIQFTDQSTGGATSWNWDFGNGDTSTDQNPEVTFLTGDDYEITLAIQDANGCRDTVTQSIAVITGLEDYPAGMLRVSPNPTNGSVQLYFDDGYLGPRSIELVTLQGGVVYRQAGVTASRVDIPLADQPVGMYIIRVGMGGRLVNRKVVKIH